jgi:hypothetical protein
VLSPPNTDLSVFPIVPPVEPACPKASDPLAKNIIMARKGLVAAPLIRVLNFQSFFATNGQLPIPAVDRFKAVIGARPDEAASPLIQ